MVTTLGQTEAAPVAPVTLSRAHEKSAGGAPAIIIEDLHKTYPGKKAVDGVSLAVLRGEIFGILGPNGAGKSTALEIVEGLREPDARPGTNIIVDGLDVRDPGGRNDLHQRIGLQLQTSALFDELTVRENLDLLAALYRKARPVGEIIAEFDLEEKANARLDTLSGGQKQRLALAAALVNDPGIVMLDEPTTALDPAARRMVWDRVRALQQAGKTVVLTTHYMEEAELLCDRVAIMDNGKIIALGTPAQLIQQYAREQSITVRFAQDAERVLPAEALLSMPGVTGTVAVANGYSLTTTDMPATLSALMRHAAERDVSLAEATTRPPSLEDVFIQLTGKALRD